jgi:hypothetical protein
MKIIVMFLLIVSGIFVLGTDARPLGALMIAAGIWVFNLITPGEKERFIGVLMLLGAAGALFTVGQFIYQRITALL